MYLIFNLFITFSQVILNTFSTKTVTVRMFFEIVVLSDLSFVGWLLFECTGLSGSLEGVVFVYR